MKLCFSRHILKRDSRYRAGAMSATETSEKKREWVHNTIYNTIFQIHREVDFLVSNKPKGIPKKKLVNFFFFPQARSTQETADCCQEIRFLRGERSRGFGISRSSPGLWRSFLPQLHSLYFSSFVGGRRLSAVFCPLRSGTQNISGRIDNLTHHLFCRRSVWVDACAPCIFSSFPFSLRRVFKASPGDKWSSWTLTTQPRSRKLALLSTSLYVFLSLRLSLSLSFMASRLAHVWVYYSSKAIWRSTNGNLGFCLGLSPVYFCCLSLWRFPKMFSFLCFLYLYSPAGTRATLY